MKHPLWSALKTRCLLPLALYSWVWGAPEWSGYLRNHVALRTVPDLTHDLVVLENKVRLEAQEAGDVCSFKASLDFIHDGADSGSSALRVDLRDAYVDASFAWCDLRLGKQVVAWGKADGLFITDIVTPKDYSRFLLAELADIRRPIPLLKWTAFLGDYSLESIWIPRFYPNEYGGLLASVLSSAGEMEIQRELPNAAWDNGEWGLRFSGLMWDVDVSLIYFNTWSDDPMVESGEAELPDTVKAFLSGYGIDLPAFPAPVLKHHRLDIAGGTFSVPVLSSVVRGEAAFYNNAPFAAIDSLPTMLPRMDSLIARARERGVTPMDEQAILQSSLAELTGMSGSFPKALPGEAVLKDYLHYMIGIDYMGVSNHTLGIQFIQQAILEFDSSEEIRSRFGAFQDGYDSWITLLAKGKYLSETLSPEFLLLYQFQSESLILRPSLQYNLVDGVWVTLGYDHVAGESEGMLGQFDNMDNGFFKVKYSF